MTHTIGFIGGGNMATSLIGGLIAGGTFTPENIIVSDPSKERTEALNGQFRVRIAGNNSDLITKSDVVIIAVKPQALEGVLMPLRSDFESKQTLIISIVAGITADTIRQWSGADLPIVRVMPNTPALVGAGASGLFANAQVNDAQRTMATKLLNAVGYSAWVSSESDIDSVTALSGSGPAYFMLFIKSLVEAGVKGGLDEQTAKQLALKTASGAAALIESSDKDLQTLIDNVTSPGGTTERALLVFREAGLPQIVETAFNAAKHRSRELAKELS